ncbi:ISAs1 family transposase [Streptomyces sp. NPDC000349]|uniref:ISAs1 family transposase n=1 Tax=Streptomyces sp. NPDC000349 TaxID=3154249 RepID=UPI003369E856
MSVLLIACSAVLAGARSFAAIGQWARNAPQNTLARLGARTTTVFGARIAPSTATVRRVLNAVCPGGLADLLGADPAGADTLAVDGKSARGSRTATSPAAHLLAAMTGTGQTVSQLRVPDKTNEITCFAALLQPYDLAGVTVTADALHTQREHARFLVEDKKAHYLLLIKANQPGLFRQLRSLPWTQATARRYDRETGHGRKETRTTRALTVTDLGLDFPPRGAGRDNPAPPHRPALGKGDTADRLRTHRPHRPPGISPAARATGPFTMGDREPAALRP